MLTVLVTVIELYASRTKRRHIGTTQVNNPLESHILVLHCDIQSRDLRVSLPLCRCVRLRFAVNVCSWSADHSFFARVCKRRTVSQ